MEQLPLAPAHIQTVKAFMRRRGIKVYKTFTLDEGLQFLKTLSFNKETNYQTITISAKTRRHQLFLDGHLFCTCCGLEGTEFRIEIDERCDTPHHRVSLYGKNNKNEMIELTWDHIIPKSCFGNNSYLNAQINCQKCNQKKSSNLTPEEINDLLTDVNFSSMVKNVKNATNKLKADLRKKYKKFKIVKFHNPVKKPSYHSDNALVEMLLSRNKGYQFSKTHNVWRYKLI